MQRKYKMTDSASSCLITFIDFETTGVVDHHPDEPWQIGIVRFKNGQVDPQSLYTSLLRVPPRPFSPHAPGRHESLRDEIAAAPNLPDLWPQLAPLLSNCPLGAHNASAEKRVLRQAFPMHRMTTWVDTLKLARIAYPDKRSHRLSDLIEDLQLVARIESLVPDGGPHDALYDAVASAALLEALMALPGWEDLSLDALVHARESSFHRNVARKRQER